jgi:hypothetical protein
MTTAVAEALKYATTHGIPSVNLSTGADESKLRWRPRPVGYVDAVALRPGARARLSYQALTSRNPALLRIASRT